MPHSLAASAIKYFVPFSRPYNIYIKEINGLRGLCSLLVFLSHYYILFSPKLLSLVETKFNLLALLGDYGRFGVDIFFCISGFFVYLSVFRPGYRPLTYLSRRISRIYPLYSFLLLIYFLLLLWPRFVPDEAVRLLYGYNLFSFTASYLYQLFFIPTALGRDQALGVSWSLFYEFIFYFFAMLLPSFRTEQPRFPFLGLSIFTSRQFFFALIYALLCFFYPRMVFFLPGFFCAHYYSLILPLGCRLKKTSGFLFELSGFMSIIFFFLLAYHSQVFKLNPFTLFFQLLPRSFTLTNVYPAIYLVCAAFLLTYFFACILSTSSSVLAFSNHQISSSLISRMLNMPLLQFLGTISFSLYLFHPFALKASLMLKPSPYVGFVVSLILSFVGSYLLFFLFEKSLLKSRV